jgi:hypothetical protein
MSTKTSKRQSVSARPRDLAAPRRWSIAGHCVYRHGVLELRTTDAPLPRITPSYGDESEFALIDEEGLLLLCYRPSKTADWSVADFRWSGDLREGEIPPLHRTIEHRCHLAILEPGEDGPMLAHNCTLSLDFTRALYAAIRERASEPWNPSTHSRICTTLLGRWPSLPALVSRAGVRSHGCP